MKRRPTSMRPPPTTARQRRRVRGRALDELAKEAIDLCAWVVARCGYSPAESSRRFKWRCDEIPASIIGRGQGTSTSTDLAAHVLTIWRNDGNYLFPNGDPRPLGPRGPAPSIEALVRRVDRSLEFEDAMSYLLNTGSLRRVGTRYVPRDVMVAHPGNSASQQAHHMRALVDFLRNLDHNTKAERWEDRWFQYSADNLHVPRDQLPVFHGYARKSGGIFLMDKDTLMYRLAQARRPGEPTVPVSIGVYISQGPADRRRTKSKRTRKSASGK